MKIIPILVLAAAACGPKKSDPVPPGPGVVEGPPPPGPSVPAPAADDALIAEARAFVAATDKEARRLYTDASVADWANQTDITPQHEDAAAKAGAELAKGLTKAIKAARKFEPVLDKLDPATRRQLHLLKFAGQPAPDDPKQADELAKVGAQMTSIYGKGKSCVKENGKQVCRDIDAASKVMQKSRKPAELLAVWEGWHNSVGRAERDLFVKFVELANAGSRGVGFKDVGSMWKSGYDMPEDAFVTETDRLWTQMKPLYDQLHCYARRKLNKKYGDKIAPKTGAIPAHLTGNMWAQSWSWMAKEMEPYPGQAGIDVSSVLEKSYDEKKMVRMAEGFYTSLGMPPLPDTFWERSMFQKPEGKEVVCHASAWDVTLSNDLRIKMCMQKTQEELVTVHHELGHNYYYAAYYKEPVLFQNGANDGFHEAIGDTVALSMTPTYLKEKGLLQNVVKNDKATINQQMRNALDSIAFLPFALVVDKWRWDVFSGKVKPDQYNQHWWDLRKQYQGVVPPVARAATDFDPGAKYHVPANTPYMRYFLARVLQYQFHRSLCAKAGHKGPLHECSIYNNKEAGAAFWKLLQTGAKQPWQDTLAELTGSREMDATAILEYFTPLQKWLETQNKGQTCGW
ncbi:MAG: M2 family metallopeptidase [Kofleriaceae bacterium]